MSILANPLQSTVFLPPNSNDDLVAVSGTQGNPAGFGASQIVQFNTPIALPIGAVIPVQVTCPKPAPLWAISTETASDRLVIRTVNNQNIQLQTPTTINGVITGFNNGYFQPSAGQTYIFYFVVGTAKGANAQCFELQAVIENTIGQYVDLGSVTTTRNPSTLPSKSTYQLGTTVSLNTTSTLANTVYIDFSNWPVVAGRNTLATGIALLTAQANKSVSSAFTNNAGSQWEPFQIVGGQTFAFEVQAQREGYWTGRISIAIAQVGVVTLSPTIPCTAISQTFEMRYTTVGDNAVSSQDIDAGRLMLAIENLNTKFASLAANIEDSSSENSEDSSNKMCDLIHDLTRKNEAAHTEIFRILGRLAKKINYVDKDDESVADNSEKEPIPMGDNHAMLPVSDSSASILKTNVRGSGAARRFM